MSALIPDLKYAIRTLLKSRGFTTVALVTLALCIGANTTIFSVIHGVLLRPLPYPEAERLVTLFNAYPAVAPPFNGENGVPDYLDRKEETDVFESLALVHFQSYNIGAEGSPQRVSGARTTPSLLTVLRTQPQLGRPFTEAEANLGNDRVAILGHGLWQEMFAGSPSVLGESIRIDGIDHEIVGVMPVGFDVLERDLMLIKSWAFTEEERDDNRRHGNYAKMIGRLRPGVGVEVAQERIDALNERNLERFPGHRSFVERMQFRTVVIGLHDQTVQFVRPALYILQASVALVLLIGCVNIANLLMIRSNGRTQELAIRFAMGAGRWRVTRQLLTESVVLAVLGGVLGLIVGMGGLRALTLLGIEQLPRIGDTTIDPMVIAFTMVMAMVTGLVFGTIPALHVSHGNLETMLRQAGRTGSSGRSAAVTRGVLVVTQVSLAFVLLIGAGLLLVSFARVLRVDPGFRPEQVLTAQLSLPVSRYDEDETIVRFTARAREAIRALPSVRAVGLTTLLPFSDDGNKSVVVAEGYDLAPDEGLPLPHNNWVEGDYFAALGIPLIAGRIFDARDDGNAPLVAMVDQDFAQQYWPGEDPIGKRLHRGGGTSNPWLTVVGLVGTVKMEDLGREDDRGAVYFALGQDPLRLGQSFDVNLVIRADGSQASLGNMTRSTILDLDPELPLYDVKTMKTRLGDSLMRFKVPMTLLLVFAGIALLLSAIGIYGVLAYSVSQRTKEIGIRMALGAEPIRILRQVMWQGGKLVVIGLVIGVGGAVWLTRLMSSLLYAVEPTDPSVFAAVAALLAIVALVACLIPSQRAVQVNPVTALRCE